ncbi:serine acetyltransferase [Mariprofundus sp. EBB-1]|uniref:serine O-acetyltransferase n=1 Tax=Mariprofundus sp. EBB-1 TaxID=2650971 RepID=UPI000EF1EC87|nr:serine acetyltransferase [Mariprofundus sp. EBB-1]RLL55877.1 serine acetyltransferase [Mariprofundus sp. EBB-1]
MPISVDVNRSMMGDFKADLTRYKKGSFIDISEPSIWVVFLYRLGKSIRAITFSPLRFVCNLIFLPVFFLSTVFIGITIPRGCEIGPGLRIYHFGGIVLNPLVTIGRNCTMRHGVTIGNRQADDDVPVIGDNVDIGAGAKILGKIRIGNNVSIGANAVVLIDIPDDHVAVGVPARAIPKTATASTDSPEK